jgi:hypothetical protein
METNFHLFLSHTQKDFEKVADVPIINHFTKKLPLSNLQEVLIPPQTLISITCKLLQNDDPQLFLKKQERHSNGRN